jgi:hypothetical protein
VVSLPTPGLAYLPKQGAQTTDKLYLADASNFNWTKQPIHGWCELDLGNPQTKGPWYIGTKVGDYGTPNYYQFARYIFSIPEAWANQYVPGYRLITGCCRTGGQSGGGPTMYAFGPWNSGNPPPVNEELKYQVLLQYDACDGDFRKHYPNYLLADSWVDGAWISADGKSAVLICGKKGFGEYWYGYSNGTRDDNTLHKSIPPLIYMITGDKGGRCNEWRGQFVFYSPDDLAAVARGKKAPWEPQPYAVLNIDGFLYDDHGFMSIAYDSQSSVLYASEEGGDGDSVLVHAWKIGNVAGITDFDATQRIGNEPLSVSFLDRSTNNPTGWTWDFGDGSVSNKQNPVHSYTRKGIYTVSLYVETAQGFRMCAKSRYVFVGM